MPFAIRTRGIGPAAPMVIAEDEFGQIAQSFERLFLVERLCDKFSMILENYKDLESECANISLDTIIARTPDFGDTGRRFERVGS